MLPLTKKQLRVLDTLRSFSKDEGRMPSVRELARILDLSCSTTHQHLRALQKKGFLATDGTAHGIALKLAEAPIEISPRNLIQVPLVGTIAAGSPIEAFEVADDPLVLSADMAPEGSYALRVQGNSMIDDHILDGDLIVIRPQQRVEQGEIAVALLDDGTATLKRVYRDKGKVRLQPANEELEPIFVDNVTIQGKVVAVLRLP